MTMIRPNFLQKGDTVALVSPSGPIQKDSIDFAVQVLTSWGLHVKIGRHAYERDGVFAGTDECRRTDFQQAINDKKIKAIICTRGGYGAIRIVEGIDYSKLLSNPKWIVGFSDITVFHSKMNSLGVESIHGAMAKSFPNVTEESLQTLHDTLFGKIKPIKSAVSHANRPGKCTGKLVGGNLSMLYSIRGLSFEYDYDGAVLFIEDLNEYLYHIDRMIQNLKHSGILGKLSGLIVGTMSGMKNGVDEYHGSVESIILDAVKEYDYPVAFDFPSGHEEQNHALIFGATYTLSVTKKGGTLKIAKNVQLV